jgi:hypothetical protein
MGAGPQAAQVEQKEGEKESLQTEVKDLDDALEDLRQQIIDRNLMIEGREAAVNLEKLKVSLPAPCPAVEDWSENHIYKSGLLFNAST